MLLSVSPRQTWRAARYVTGVSLLLDLAAIVNNG